MENKMLDDSLSIIIATHNRSQLIIRAINSALSQLKESDEIIVVDDASTDDTESVVRSAYPQIKYIKLDVNSGPGPARDKGLQSAVTSWALILDDDDWLLPNTLNTVREKILGLGVHDKYPVINFMCSNATQEGSYRCLNMGDYVTNKVIGDHVPVFNLAVARSFDIHYPAIRVGGESLLWWKVADRFGIPSFSEKIVQVGDDAPLRLTTYTQQIVRAQEYAELQELIIKKYGDKLKELSPITLRDKMLGASVYWLLAGKRKLSRQWAMQVYRELNHGYGFTLYALSVMPISLMKRLFLYYRSRKMRVASLK